MGRETRPVGGFLSRELGSSKDDPFFYPSFRPGWHMTCFPMLMRAAADSQRIRSTFNGAPAHPRCRIA